MSDSNDMRELLRKMRNANNNKIDNNNLLVEYENDKKDLSVRDMLKITRNKKLNEDTLGSKKTTSLDQKREEEKFLNYFKDNQVNVEFIDLEVFDNGVFWGGTIDGEVQWVYKVTPDEETSGVEINYLEGFDSSDPENNDIVKKLEAYYDEFFKYWRDNEIQQ